MINVLNLHIKVATVTALCVDNIGLLAADVAASVLKLSNMLFISGLTSYRTSFKGITNLLHLSAYVFEVCL
jgi:hypothetical protein